MKFFLPIAVSAFLFGAPALANEISGVEVTGSLPPTTAEVFPLASGSARIEIGPIYGVFLNQMPAGMKAYHSDADRSGKGVAHVAKWNQMPYESHKVCFKEAGPNWNAAPICGKMFGTLASIEIHLGARRNEAFALVPVVIDRSTGAILTWLAHPRNTQTQLRCGTKEDMASVFYIDGAGVISIATKEQMAAYQAVYCRGG